MKIFPRVFIVFSCVLSATLASTRAQDGTDSSGGTLSLGGAVVVVGDTSTVSGATTLTSGTLQISSSDPIITGGTITVNDSTEGGTLSVVDLTKTGTGTLTLGTTTGTFTDGSGAAVTVLTGGTIANGIITSGAINEGTLSLGGTLNLLGSANTINTIAGTSPILFAGTPTFGINGGTLAAASPILTSGGTLTLNSTGTLTVPVSTTLNLTVVNSPIILSGGAALSAGSVNLPISTGLTINTSAGASLNLIPTISGIGSTTNVSFLSGVTSNAGSVSLLYLPSTLNLAGNPLELHMSDFDSGLHDQYVLQLSYNAATAAALGDLSKLYLAWYDPADGTWKNAVDGDSDGGASATFVNGAFDPSTDFNLGTYGVDTANSTVWAVVDHNSTFGVANSDLQPQGVPEPSVAALLVCGVALQLRRPRKR